jgi:hypothetical protein
MNLRFGTQPGRRERQLQRRHSNPLFGDPVPAVTQGELERARSADRQEAAQFERQFTELVQRAAGLQPSEDSEVILQLKSDLDQAYEQASGLTGDWSAQKQAIGQLVGLIMNAVRRGAGDDAQALDELRQEEEARSAHYRLLESPLVADLLHPETPIPPQELAPTLLSCDAEELQLVLPLFDKEQIRQLQDEAYALLATREAARSFPEARERLRQITGYLQAGDIAPVRH